MNIDLPTSISDWDTLKRYKTKHMVPICSSANGNCFFNSLSIALYGDESNVKILKMLTAIWYASNHKIVDKHYPRMQIAFESKLSTLKSGAIDGAWSDIRTFICASNALNIAIKSVYPPHNGLQDIMSQTLNTVIIPINCPDQGALRTASVLWTGGFIKTTSGKVFKPNHFVPLVPECENRYLVNFEVEKSSDDKDYISDDCDVPIATRKSDMIFIDSQSDLSLPGIAQSDGRSKVFKVENCNFYFFKFQKIKTWPCYIMIDLVDI